MIGVGRDIECTGHAANELDRASVEPAATCKDRHTFLDSTWMQPELPSGILWRNGASRTNAGRTGLPVGHCSR
jgi:hypothetical protein